MALVQCPECHRQISNSAKSCPQCGYVFSAVETVSPQIKQTNLGEKQRNIAAGLPYFLFGILIVVVGAILVGIIIGMRFKS